MSKFYTPFALDLQLFAEGGASDGGATGNGDGSVTGAEGNQADKMLATSKRGSKNPLADVKYGIQQDDAQVANVPTTTDGDGTPTNSNPTDRNAEFEKLIKGEYKDLYEERIKDTIQKRFKNTEETVTKFNELVPTIEMLAKKYGVDATDIKALNKAIEEDDAYYEEEALEKGIPVEQLKSIRRMEKENSELKRQMREQEARENADRIYAGWMQQAESTKLVYPNFNLQSELQNQKFVDLLRSNIDVKTAYEVVHKDEIIPAAMQFTAQKVGQQLTNKIIAQGARPIESGVSSHSSAEVKRDVTLLTKADRAEINRRVARGEKITF